MDLKIADLAELLQVTEKTIYRWLREKKIPAYRINHQYRFNKAEISAWLIEHRVCPAERLAGLTLTGLPVRLADMLARGGVYRDVPGGTPAEVIRNAVLTVDLPPGADREKIAAAVLLREGLAPTALGRGVAVPHPRTPILTDAVRSEVSICLLKRPVDFGALDGLPVHTLFLVLAANSKRHLEILARISYFCRDETFLKLLEERRPAAAIAAFLEEAERARPAKGDS